MKKLYDPSHILNVNDNHISSWFQKGDVEESVSYACYVPLANAIIKNYCTLWYKTQPQTSEFQHMQMAICGLLFSYEAYGTTGVIQLIASLIECNPIVLMNDTELNLLHLLQKRIG